MGEQLFGSPLEILNEKEIFDAGLTIGEVIQRAGISKNAMAKARIDFYKRIFAMCDDGLISPIEAYDKSRVEEYRHNDKLYINVDSARIRITAKGFDLLNDIRMKKIMEDVTDSMNKTNASVKELNKGILDFKQSSNKSSNWLIILTGVIIIATTIQIFIALKWI